MLGLAAPLDGGTRGRGRGAAWRGAGSPPGVGAVWGTSKGPFDPWGGGSSTRGGQNKAESPKRLSWKKKAEFEKKGRLLAGCVGIEKEGVVDILPTPATSPDLAWFWG